MLSDIIFFDTIDGKIFFPIKSKLENLYDESGWMISILLGYFKMVTSLIESPIFILSRIQ